MTVSLAWDQSERDYMGIRTGAKLHYVLWEIQAWSAPTHSPYGFILIDNSNTKDLWGDNRLKEDYSSLNGFHGKIRPSWHELYWNINILLDDNSLIWHGDIFKRDHTCFIILWTVFVIFFLLAKSCLLAGPPLNVDWFTSRGFKINICGRLVYLFVMQSNDDRNP